jgi:phage-related holin
MIPQLIFLFLITIGLGTQISKHGEQKKSNTYNGWIGIVNYIITLGLLYWGGFFNLH